MSENNNFCTSCNEEINKNDDVIICKSCGMPYHKKCWDENKGCITFACDMQDSVTLGKTKNKTVKKKSNAPLIIILSVVITLIFALVIGGVYLSVFKSETKKNDDVENNTSQTAEKETEKPKEKPTEKETQDPLIAIIKQIKSEAELAKQYTEDATERVELANDAYSYEEVYIYLSSASDYYDMAVQTYKKIASLCANYSELSDLKKLCNAIKTPEIYGKTKDDILNFINEAEEYVLAEYEIKMEILYLK